jgi:hypothetical protein
LPETRYTENVPEVIPRPTFRFVPCPGSLIPALDY